jgi:hypothetical protein
MEDDLQGRRLPGKTTSSKDDFQGRQHPGKTPSREESQIEYEFRQLEIS